MRTHRLYTRLYDSSLVPNDIKPPILWTPDGVLLAPLINYEDGLQFLYYDNIDIQQMFANIVVPSDYVAGTLITLKKGIVVSQAAAGNILMRCQTTLIREGTTILGVYPNQHTSTNAEISLSVAFEFGYIGDIDLTSAIGQINAVAVLPNDILRVRLYRDFATETIPAAQPARVLTNSFVPFFN